MNGSNRDGKVAGDDDRAVEIIRSLRRKDEDLVENQEVPQKHSDSPSGWDLKLIGIKRLSVKIQHPELDRSALFRGGVDQGEGTLALARDNSLCVKLGGCLKGWQLDAADNLRGRTGANYRWARLKLGVNQAELTVDLKSVGRSVGCDLGPAVEKNHRLWKRSLLRWAQR